MSKVMTLLKCWKVSRQYMGASAEPSSLKISDTALVVSCYREDNSITGTAKQADWENDDGDDDR
jgi:hypothetical protein